MGGDLHHHLGGSIPPSTLIAFSAESGLCLPEATEEPLSPTDPAAAPDWTLRPPPCTEGLRPVSDALEEGEFRSRLLRAWSMKDFLSNDPLVDRLAANAHFFGLFGKIDLALDDMGRNLAAVRNEAAAQGVRYLETSTSVPASDALWELVRELDWDDDLEDLRFRLLSEPGFDDARDFAVSQVRRGLTRAEELLGCEGSSPEPGCAVLTRLQFIGIRTMPREPMFSVTLLGYEVAAQLDQVVGVNLVAPEHHSVSIRDYDLHMRMHGILGPHYPEVGRALHAAEFTDAQAVRLGALDHLQLALAPPQAGGAQAQRLGHAVSLDVETKRQWVLETLRSRNVAVEINLRSNEQLLGVRGTAHPITDYLAADVPIVLSTDDPGLMLTTMREQFVLAAAFSEVDYLALKGFVFNSIRYGFHSSGDRERLLDDLTRDFAEFERGLAQN